MCKDYRMTFKKKAKELTFKLKRSDSGRGELREMPE